MWFHSESGVRAREFLVRCCCVIMALLLLHKHTITMSIWQNSHRDFSHRAKTKKALCYARLLLFLLWKRENAQNRLEIDRMIYLQFRGLSFAWQWYCCCCCSSTVLPFLCRIVMPEILLQICCRLILCQFVNWIARNTFTPMRECVCLCESVKFSQFNQHSHSSRTQCCWIRSLMVGGWMLAHLLTKGAKYTLHDKRKYAINWFQSNRQSFAFSFAPLCLSNSFMSPSPSPFHRACTRFDIE